MFEELLQQVPEVQGVARLVTQPSFYAAQYLTLAYTPRVVVASAFSQRVGLWVEYPLAPGGSLSPDVVSRIVPWLSLGVAGFERMAASRYVPASHCPELIGSWPLVRSAGEQAGSCFSAVPDGGSYHHELHDRGGVIAATWHSPRPEYGFPAQAALVSAYARLQAAAGLTPKLIRQAFGIDDTPERPTPAFLGTSEAAEEPEGPAGRKRRKPWQPPRR